MGKGAAVMHIHFSFTSWRRPGCCPFALVLMSILFCGGHVVADDNDDVQQLATQIDEQIARQWDKNNVSPASRAEDSEFLRRGWLDIAGRIPTVADTSDFLEDSSPDKRRRLIDNLLDGPNYVVSSTNVWRRVLIPEADSNFNVRYMIPSFEGWLRRQFDENKPYDELVKDILTTPVSGVNVYDNSNASAVAFYQAKEIKPENLAAATSRMFLGIRIECAQCHDHPFDSWKQKDFWGYASFFSGMQRQRRQNGFLGRLQELFNRQSLKIPDSDEVVHATFLTGESPKIPAGSSARITLADWITSKENPYFARTAVNRIWGHLFGIGIVDPIDDFSDANPPSHPELLDLLAREFVAHDYDLKFIIRAISASSAYQLTSAADDQKAEVDPRLFSRMPVKGMTAEQLFDSLSQAVGNHQSFDQLQQMRFAQTGRQAFIQQFSDSANGPTDRETSVLQALAMMNGSLVAEATDLKQSRTLAGIIDFPGFDDARRLEALFLATLNRKPRPAETEKFLPYISGADSAENKATALSDVFWILLNSSEFSLNH